MPTLTLVLIALISLLVGFLLGWLVEWRIDLAYWRSYFKSAEEEEASERIIELQARQATLELPPAGQEMVLTALREQVAQRETDLATLRGTIEQLGASEGRWREREAELLEMVRRRQAEAEALAEAKADAEAEWRHELAQREAQWQSAKDADLAAVRAELDQARAQAEAAAAAQLAAADQQWRGRYDQEIAAARAEADRLAAQLADLDRRFTHYKRQHPETLAAIDGIGPTLEEVLRQAGIHTYADLAARRPEELQALLNPPKWRKLDFDHWIMRARQLAQEEA